MAVIPSVFRDRSQTVAGPNCPGLRFKVLVGAGSASPAEGWVSYAELLSAEASGQATEDTLATDEAFCFFTSGTTGKPKMTVHTQASYGIAHTTTGKFWLNQKPGDLHWNITDTGWAKAAWSSYFGPFICGSCVLVDDAVAESAVVSSPDETRGEVVKAFIVLAAGHAPGDELRTELQQYVKSNTAPYKYPRKIEFVESLPKTVSEKIKRKELRDQEWQQAR